MLSPRAWVWAQAPILSLTERDVGEGKVQTSEHLSPAWCLRTFSNVWKQLGGHSDWGYPWHQETRGNKHSIMQLHRTVSQNKELCHPNDHEVSTE